MTSKNNALYVKRYREKNLAKCRRWTREYMRRNKHKFRRTRAEKDAHNAWKRNVWYRNNRERVLAKNTERAETFRQILRALKDVPCTDYGKRYPYYIMDFDHVRGEKIIEVGRLLAGANLDRLIAEVEKCEIVCGNCHRERTHQRRLAAQED